MNSIPPTTVFWGLSALLVLVALGFVLPPLLRGRERRIAAGRRGINVAVYRDQMRELEADRASGLLDAGQFAAATLELEARLAQDAVEGGDDVPAARRGGKRLGFGLTLLLPLSAFGVYFLLGNPSAILESAHAQAQAHSGAAGHDFAQMLEKLDEKVKANPQDIEAWIMLGKTYGAIERWPEAVGAYEQASKLAPKNAALLAHYGEALAIRGGRDMKGRPMELIRQALEIDPREPKALELAGINAYQDQNYSQAAYYWKQLAKVLPPDDPYTQDIQKAMKEAKRLAEEAAFGPPVDKLSGQHAQAGTASLGGMVELAPALKGKIKADDVVFLFARPVSGDGPPVAALRVTADKLPAPFLLDDSLAMTPENALSKHANVTLVARLSKSGTAEARPGDLEGLIQSVKVGSQGVKLVIDTVRK